MTNTPAIIKEYLFHLLAQSLRILHYSEGCNSSKLPTLNPHLNPSTGLLVQLQAELRRLYEEETKGNTLNSGIRHIEKYVTMWRCPLPSFWCKEIFNLLRLDLALICG